MHIVTGGCKSRVGNSSIILLKVHYSKAVAPESSPPASIKETLVTNNTYRQCNSTDAGMGVTVEVTGAVCSGSDKAVENKRGWVGGNQTW